MGDAVNRGIEEETSSQSSPADSELICGAQKVRNFIAKLRRNSFAGEASARNLYVVERKLSSGFCYKLKDEKSAVKTLWPVACREFIFLPEFKVQHGDIEARFEIINYVAKGSFGKVYKVRKLADPQTYFALKVLEKSKIIVDDYVQQLKYEVLIQQAISHHPFITTSHEHWQNKGFIFQLTDFITEGELFHKISRFTHKLTQLYVAELALVIDFLHNAGIIYRDLKSENILLDENFHVKLTDFGLSKCLKVGKRTFTICGTHSSMAPEIFTGEGYSHAVDWYALGVLAARMMCSHQKPENDCEDEFKDFDRVDDARCAIEENEKKPIDYVAGMLEKSELNDASKDLLRRLLEKSPQHRLKSLLGLQRIAFFQHYNFDDVRHMKISPRKLMLEDAAR